MSPDCCYGVFSCETCLAATGSQACCLQNVPKDISSVSGFLPSVSSFISNSAEQAAIFTLAALMIAIGIMLMVQ